VTRRAMRIFHLRVWRMLRFVNCRTRGTTGADWWARSDWSYGSPWTGRAFRVHWTTGFHGVNRTNR